MISILVSRGDWCAQARRLFVSASLALLLTAPAFAATKNWLAPAFGGDRRWSVGTNWGTTVPVNGDSLVFNEKSDTTFQDDSTNNLSSLQLGSILFNGPNNSVPDIWGNGVTLSGGISESVSFWGAKFFCPVTLSANQTFESLLDGHLDVTNVNVNAHILTLSTRLNSSRISMDGRISGSGTIIITGPGDVTFNSTLTNIFSGLTRVDSGRLNLSADNSGVGVPSVSGPLVVGNGVDAAIVSLTQDNQIEGDVTLRPGAKLQLNGAIDTIPSLTLIDGDVLIFSGGLLALAGPVNVGGTSNSTIRGDLSLGLNSRTFNISNNVTLRLQSDVSGVNLSLNRPGITKEGPGTLLLLSNCTYAGNMVVNDGRVVATTPRSLGAESGAIASIQIGRTFVNEGGELLLGTVNITNEVLLLNGTTGGLSTTGACKWAGSIALTTNAPFNISNSTFTVDGVISGNGGFLKREAGTLALGGATANTFTGPVQHGAGVMLLSKPAGVTAISGSSMIVGDGVGGANADIVRVQNAEQISDSTSVQLLSSGQLDLNAAETVASVGGSGQIRLDGGELTFGGDGVSATMSGTIVGTFGLTKIGAGIQTFSGPNTYTGSTRVLAGTLRVNGTQPQSPINVIGATLEGTGTVGHLTSNGRIAPGSGGRGILTCSNLTFQAGASFAVEIGGLSPGSGHDQLSVRGTVQLGNAVLMPTLSPGFLPATGDTFVILNNDGADAISGTFSGLPNNAFVSVGPGLKFQVRYNGGDGNDVSLTFVNETVVAGPAFLSAGNGNSRLDPNECSLLGGSISNQTGQALANVSVEFMPVSGGVNISHPIINFPSLPANAVTPIPPVTVVSVASSVVCGSSVRIAMVLRQHGVLINSTSLGFVVGSGGIGGCTDGGGICDYCPDVVIDGSLLTGDLVQIGTLKDDGSASKCGDEKVCPGFSTTGARLVDSLVFKNGPLTACVTVQLENLCPDANSALFAAAYLGRFNPSNLCSGYFADIGDAVVGGKTGEFGFKLGANETFVLTVNEFKTGLTCTDYRLTVSGGECRPRLSIQDIAGPNVRVSWPNSGAEWQPQASDKLNSWSNLPITPTNASGKFFFDISGGQTSRFFRLRQP